MNVLVVDDDRIALEMLAHQLTGWGYEVTTASDGRDAWWKFKEHDFSLVISDWLMPGMDGLELIGRIRSAAAQQYVYCILLTVRSQLDDLIQGMEAGADDFLTKPFEPGELRVRLRAGQRIIELERRLSLANRRMTNELEMAARIQQSLLPVRSPRLEGGSFAWGYKPCDELGGDILNVLPLASGKVALYLLDVSGHGVSAALLSVALSRLLTTASASSLIREKSDDSPDGYRIVPPGEVLARLNEQFCRDMGGERFVTIIYGVLDLRTHELCYASGGHNPALVLDARGGVKKLAATGHPLGVVEEATFDECRLLLAPDDRLLIYSDGITDAANTAGQQFGLDRLIAAVQDGHPSASIQDSLDALMHRVQEWARPDGLQDDASCLAAQALPIASRVAQELRV